MNIGRPEPREEAIYRLGSAPQPGQAIVYRDGTIGIVVPLRDGDTGGVRVDFNGDYIPGMRSWANLQQTGWRYLEPASRYKKTAYGWARWCSPFDLRLNGLGILTGTTGNANVEMAAACIVAFHQENSLTEWSPMPTKDFLSWLPESPRAKKWSLNPVWRPDFRALVKGGWVTGWKMKNADKDERMNAVGNVTPKLIECLATPRVGGFPRIKRVLS